MLLDSDEEHEAHEHDEDGEDDADGSDAIHNAGVGPSDEKECNDKSSNDHALDVPVFPGLFLPEDEISGPEDPAQDDRTWTSLGRMSKASYSNRAHNRDWTLVELTTMAGEHFKGSPRASSKELRTATPLADNGHAVIGDRSRKQCVILTLPARAMLPSGREFVDLYTIRLPSNEGKYTYRRSNRH